MIVYCANNGHAHKLKVIRENKNKLGLMFSIGDSRRVDHGYRFALDNGAFSAYQKNKDWNPELFLHKMNVHVRTSERFWPDFVILPDIVAGGLESLNRSKEWLKILKHFYQKYRSWYLAVQDGIYPKDIDNDILRNVEGIFIGGTKEWKFMTAALWVKWSHEIGKKCHIGRIGNLRALMWAQRIGPDSVDSSNFARHKKQWEELLIFLKGEQNTMSVFLRP